MKNHFEKLMQELRDSMEAMLATAEKESRDFTDTETTEYRLLEDTLGNLGKEMSKTQRSIPIPQPQRSEARYDTKPVGMIGARFEELFPEVRYNCPDVNRSLGEFFEKRTVLAGTGASGGFAVPNELWRDVYNLVLQQSIFLPRMPTFPITGGSLTIPALDSTDQTEGFVGGVESQWVAEGGTFTPATPKLREVTLKPNKNGIFMNASAEALMDSGGRLDRVISNIMALAVRQSVDNEVLNGNSVARPLGIMHSAATITVNRAVVNQVSYADLTKMVARIHPIFFSGAIWVFSPAVLEQLMNMTDASSQLIWNVNGVSGAAEDLPERLLGRPWFVSDKCADLGTTGDIVLVDPRSIAFGLKHDVLLESSNSPEWYAHLMSFRAIMRADAAPLLHATIKPKNNGATLSFAAKCQ